jgi:hypothetical protein
MPYESLLDDEDVQLIQPRRAARRPAQQDPFLETLRLHDMLENGPRRSEPKPIYVGAGPAPAGTVSTQEEMDMIRMKGDPRFQQILRARAAGEMMKQLNGLPKEVRSKYIPPEFRATEGVGKVPAELYSLMGTDEFGPALDDIAGGLKSTEVKRLMDMDAKKRKELNPDTPAARVDKIINGMVADGLRLEPGPMRQLRQRLFLQDRQGAGDLLADVENTQSKAAPAPAVRPAPKRSSGSKPGTLAEYMERKRGGGAVTTTEDY